MIRRVIATTAIAFIAATLAAATPASSATVNDLRCRARTSATFDPGISTTPAIQIVTLSTTLSHCTGVAGITDGTLTGSYSSNTPTDCSTLIGTDNITGTLTAAYNDGSTSTIALRRIKAKADATGMVQF